MRAHTRTRARAHTSTRAGTHTQAHTDCSVPCHPHKVACCQVAFVVWDRGGLAIPQRVPEVQAVAHWALALAIVTCTPGSTLDWALAIVCCTPGRTLNWASQQCAAHWALQYPKGARGAGCARPQHAHASTRTRTHRHARTRTHAPTRARTHTHTHTHARAPAHHAHARTHGRRRPWNAEWLDIQQVPVLEHIDTHCRGLWAIEAYKSPHGGRSIWVRVR